MPLAKYNDMIKTFAPDRADQPFAMPIVPWGLRRRWPISNAHRPNASAKDFAVGSIRIADQILWCALSAASFGQLSRNPFGGRMSCDIALQ
jgi:hypothetical protein